jgi:hypothetical protein
LIKEGRLKNLKFTCKRYNGRFGSLITQFAILVVTVCGSSCDQDTSKRDKSSMGLDNSLTDSKFSEAKIETATGKTYIVENNSQSLAAYLDKKILWTTNIGELFTEPIPGKNEIRSIKLEKGEIFILYGKHCYVRVDTLRGEIIDLECD